MMKPDKINVEKWSLGRVVDKLPEYNIKTIAASLRRQGLRAKATRKFTPVSYREHGLPVSENLLSRTSVPAVRTRSGQVTSRIVCPEFRVSMDAQMNQESVWNIEPVTQTRSPTIPPGVTVENLSGSDLRHACRVM